jgi:hypothetical protein
MKNKSLSKRNYFFQLVVRELNLESFDEVMIHIMSANIVAVQVCNSTEKSVVISRRVRLDRIIEYEKHECYFIDSKKTSLAIESTWKKSDSLTVSNWRKTSILVFIHINLKNSSSVKKSMKEKSLNEITTYDTLTIRQQLFDTVEKYSLWNKTENFVINVSKNEWMSITLKSDAKIEFAKIYSMSSKERELIDEIFDMLHNQRKMNWIKKSIAHEALVFVV